MITPTKRAIILRNNSLERRTISQRNNSQVRKTFHLNNVNQSNSTTTLKLKKSPKNQSHQLKNHHFNISQLFNNFWISLNNKDWPNQHKYSKRFVHFWHLSCKRNKAVEWPNYCSNGETLQLKQQFTNK